VEHLYSELGLISVGRLVDDRHSSDPEQAVEAVFSSQDSPQAPIGE
jgi:hypothetical protein